MNKILFITHDATLTGAPVLLLNLLQCLRSAGYVCDRIIIKNNIGELVNEFRKDAEVLFFNDNIIKRNTGFLPKINNLIVGNKQKKNHYKIQQWINDSDVIFSNTITNGDFLEKYHFAKEKIIISYIHELENASNYYTTDRFRKFVLEKTTCFLVPAQAVKNFLQDKFNVSADKIKLLNYFIPAYCTPLKSQKPSFQNNFVVGIIGTQDWRKGMDILPVIVLDFFTKYPAAKLQFLWKGANKLSIEYIRLIYEFKKIGLLHKIVFEESTSEVETFYTSINILLLCSKEDPYPLVVLEAAGFKKPSICFENAGGAVEFIRRDAGTTVPFLNIDMLTSAINDFYINKNTCIEKGGVAYKRLMDLHRDEALILAQFNEVFSPLYK